MKIFLIGFNASGKREVCDKLTSLGVRVGKNFRSIEDVPDNIYTNSRVGYREYIREQRVRLLHKQHY